MKKKKLLTENTNYTSKDLLYINNTYITEYDIKSAGFSIIKEYKLLDEKEIKYIETLEKQAQKIYIGRLMLKVENLSQTIDDKLKELRNEFYIQNKLEDEDILTIKRDAIFIIRKKVDILKFGKYLEFIPKNIFTSYVNLNGNEFYYSSFTDELVFKKLTSRDRIEIGISKISLKDDTILRDIKKILKISENLSRDQIFNYLKKYREDYLSKKLPLDTYRNIFSGCYDILLDNEEYYSIEMLDEDFNEEIDISQNYMNFILPLIQNIV